MVPFAGKYTIGNDYPRFPIQQQLFLQFSLKNGTFPLYAPGWSGGWTAAGLTLGQIWHPISWLSAHLPGYWIGYALDINTLLRMFSLAVTQLALFLLLRRLRIAAIFAIIVSFIAVYNLRMLDLFRYGASLENYTAFLLLCSSLMWHYITEAKRLSRGAIILSAWLLAVGGHPQMMYTGFLGTAIVGLAAPFYMALMLPEETSTERAKVLKYYASAALCIGAGILLASPYLLPLWFEYVKESWRGHLKDFAWSCQFQDTLTGPFYNFVNPFLSDVHGAFGASSLILIAATVPVLALCRVRLPLVIFLLWAVCVLLFILTPGSNTPLYYYFWKYFPVAHSLRVPGRMAMPLPFLISLILAWIVRYNPPVFNTGESRIKLPSTALLAAIGIALFAFFNYVYPAISNLPYSGTRFSPVNINDIPHTAIILITVLGIVSLTAIAFCNTSRRLSTVAVIILGTATFCQTAITLRWGTWITHAPIRTPTFEEFSREQRQQLRFRPYSGDDGAQSLADHEWRWHMTLEPTLARICHNYVVVNSSEQAYMFLSGKQSYDLAYVENYTPDSNDTSPTIAGSPSLDSIELHYSSFNNLKFTAECASPAFFIFSYPYNERWEAYVDGKRVPVYRCNGIEHCVAINTGIHQIEFRYWSWPAINGIIIAFVTLTGLAVYFSSAAQRPRTRIVIILAVVCACCIFFLVWYHSLYNGQNIGTRYDWWKKPSALLMQHEFKIKTERPTSNAWVGLSVTTPLSPTYFSIGILFFCHSWKPPISSITG